MTRGGPPRGLVVLAAVLALEAVVLFGKGDRWRGEWNWTLDHLLGSLVLTGPLVAAAAAWIAYGERSRADLNDSTAYGWLVPLRAAVVALVLGLAGWAAAAVVAAVATLSVPHGGPLAAEIAVIVPCVLGFHAVLGAAVGHCLPHLVAVALVAPAFFVYGVFGQLGIGPNFLRHGPSSGGLVGLDWDRAVVVGQIAVLVGVALGAGCLLGLVVRGACWWLVASALGGLLLAGAGLHRLGDHDERLVVVGEPTTACAGRRPEVCVAPSNRRVLAPYAARIRLAARELVAAGAELPSRYVAWVPGNPVDLSSGRMSLPYSANDPALSPAEAAFALTVPAPCPAWSDEAPVNDAAYVARDLIVAWILHRQGAEAPEASPRQPGWLARVPLAEQQAWIRATFAQLRSCDLEHVEMPWRT